MTPAISTTTPTTPLPITTITKIIIKIIITATITQMIKTPSAICLKIKTKITEIIIVPLKITLTKNKKRTIVFHVINKNGLFSSYYF